MQKKTKKRITDGELLDAIPVGNFNESGECVLLVFATAPHIKPVKPKKYPEYIALFKSIFPERIDYIKKVFRKREG